MNHRDYTMLAFDDFFKDKDLKGMKVLDVGCQNRELKPYLEKYGLEWYGLDVINTTDESILHANMSKMPLPDNEFDIVVVCHSWEHCERPVDALKEFKRVAKKWIFIAAPSPCKHQILEADEDHIFVMNEMQMERLFKYIKIKDYKIYLQTKNIPREQDYNIISIAIL